VQQKNTSNSDFLERTDKLSNEYGCSLRELAPKIGVSEATLFGARSGKIPISLKTWSKLEHAEESLGLNKAVYPVEPTQNPLQVVEPPGSYGCQSKGRYLEQRVSDLESKYVEILEMFSELRNGQKKILRASEKNGGTADEH